MLKRILPGHDDGHTQSSKMMHVQQTIQQDFGGLI